MPPLKNIKHEKFVRNVISSPTYTEAYQKTYEAEYDCARANAPRLLAKDSVKNRLLEVFEEKGIDDKRITEKLNELLDNPKGNVQLGTVRTILEVRKDIDSAAKIGIQVNLETEKKAKVTERMKRFNRFIDAQV